MKIIDWVKKGNVIRLYLGKNDETKYWGDGWQYPSYEHNADKVYTNFIAGICDVSVPFEYDVVEPADDWNYHGSSPFSKKDFMDRKVPFIVIAPKEVIDELISVAYSKVTDDERCIRLYFEDRIGETIKALEDIGCIISRKVEPRKSALLENVEQRPMTTKESLEEYIKRQKAFVGEDPIFEIFVFETPGKVSPLGYPEFGASATMGYFHSLQEAIDAVENNDCDIQELCYNGAFIICRFPGLYDCVSTPGRLFYRWNREQKKFVQEEEPKIYYMFSL